MAKVDPLTTTWADDEVTVMHRLRDWAVTFDELQRHLSSWMRLPGTDANALGQVVWAEQAGEPLSPAQLARQIGLTTGATSVLIDRLETAGHVTRHRESTDRRRITLRPTASARAETERFLAFAGVEIATTLQETDPTTLRAAMTFLTSMTAAAATANARLARHRSSPTP
ncbi:MarR family winged helix-turn-helix transcriptional regulator [Curtobacterium sp. 9128]|uniref:MarR family winged helix-turn-helix transcriptional regulator n=1 Tax=Curtobacterium sp. 9128 TaxID=1793722 RepID=UPI0011AADE93|nr:MarR family transcriptional regulator [Curtobacterium sp. 9128]